MHWPLKLTQVIHLMDVFKLLIITILYTIIIINKNKICYDAIKSNKTIQCISQCK